jgi:DNA-binding beta-propeller fold protein YncE
VPDFEPGSVFAGHRIEAVAGRGGMGVVYRAVQLDLDRLVALKLIAPQFAQDAEFRERFVRESRAAASIDHPNVIPIYYTGESDDQLYIVMRYVEGEDLRTLSRRELLLDAGRAAHIVAQVGAALDAAHAGGIVHRDVKPANVLLDATDHAYLTDFGLTKHVHSHTASTRAGGWVGTLGYVAPEQIRGQQVDARTDVYALGCVLYHALTGSTPYQRDSDEATLWAHLHDPPPAVTDKAPGVPPAFEDVIARALAKDPADRFQSAGGLGRAALAAAAGRSAPEPERLVATGAAAPADAPTVASPSRAPTTPAMERRRASPLRRFAAPAAALLAVGGATAGAVVLLGGDGDGGQDARTGTTATTSAGPPRVTQIDLHRRANDIVYARDQVWTTSFNSTRLIGLAARTNRRTTIDLPSGPGTSAIAAGFGAVWVVNQRTRTLTRVDLATRLPSDPIALPPGQPVVVATGPSGVWVGSRTGSQNPFLVRHVVRVSPRTSTIQRELTLGSGVQHLTVGYGAVWVINRSRPIVTRIDVATGQRRNIRVGSDPQRVAAGAGFVWVTNGADRSVTRIRPASLGTRVIPVGLQPVGVGVGGGAVWVANRLDSTVTRIDPAQGKPIGAPIAVGANPTAVAVHGNVAWVATPGDDGLSRIELP